MQKKEIRKIYTNKRATLSAAQKDKLDDLLLIQFQKLQLPYIQFLMSYWSIENKGEINTQAITDFMAFRNPELKIAYPSIDFITNKMIPILVNDTTIFDTNKYGIVEPINGEILEATTIDMVLIPLLAFDVQGYRVGYGKGFYDKFLAECKTDTIKIGLCYFYPEAAISDVESFDIKMDYCITPDAIYDFIHQ